MQPPAIYSSAHCFLLEELYTPNSQQPLPKVKLDLTFDISRIENSTWQLVDTSEMSVCVQLGVLLLSGLGCCTR